MNPISKIDLPKSYKEPAVTNTSGKLGCRDVIVYKEPDSDDFRRDKDGWSSCYQSIFDKFSKMNAGRIKLEDEIIKSSLALSCPKSQRDDSKSVSNKEKESNKIFNQRLDGEVLTNAYEFAMDNPGVSITLVTSNADIMNIYTGVMDELSKSYIEVDGGKVLEQVKLREGRVEDSNSDVIAITEKEVDDVKRASKEFVKKATAEKKTTTTFQEPKVVTSESGPFWNRTKTTTTTRPDSDIKPGSDKEVGSDISKDDL